MEVDQLFESLHFQFSLKIAQRKLCALENLIRLVTQVVIERLQES